MDGYFRFLPVPTEIHFGCGVAASLPERMRALGCQRAFVVTDAGVRAAGLADQLSKPLAAAGMGCTIYDGVTADSGTGIIAEAAAQCRAAGADAVIGLGGGSSLDTAKAVAAMATHPGTIMDYAGLDKIVQQPLPIIAVPTTAGTGSEVSLWSVFVNDQTRVKAAAGSVRLFPAIALCDPDLTLTLPPAATAATGMDALGHAVECYTNEACQPISAALALRAIERIGANLRGAVLNGRRECRYGMLLASTMAGIAMNSTRLGLAHALAMPLGSWELRIPHGLAIAITLPVVMKFNHVARLERFAEVARALGEKVDGLSMREAAERSICAVKKLAQDTGIPAGLGALGLKEEHIECVAAEAIKSGNVAVNPRRATVEDLQAILREAL